MTALPIYVIIRSFVKFYALDPKLEIELVKSFRLTYRHTDEPILRISYKLIKKVISYFAWSAACNWK